MKLIYFLFAILIVLVFNVAIISAPFGIIWLVNYIFPVFSIPYSFLSWIAVMLINSWLFLYSLKQYKDKL